MFRGWAVLLRTIRAATAVRLAAPALWHMASQMHCLRSGRESMTRLWRRAVSKELAGGLSFGAVLLYVLSYALGSGPVPWVYLPEVRRGRTPTVTVMQGCKYAGRASLCSVARSGCVLVSFEQALLASLSRYALVACRLRGTCIT